MATDIAAHAEVNTSFQRGGEAPCEDIDTLFVMKLLDQLYEGQLQSAGRQAVA